MNWSTLVDPRPWLLASWLPLAFMCVHLSGGSSKCNKIQFALQEQKGTQGAVFIEFHYMMNEVVAILIALQLLCSLLQQLQGLPGDYFVFSSGLSQKV